MRRLGVAGAALLVAAIAPAPAEAARVITWTTHSRFVNLSAFNLGGTPPHRPRPPALRVTIFLPDGYDGRRRFPVLYLLHGHGEGYADWADPRKGDVLRTARGFRAIIVMPEGWRGWYANWWNGGRRGNPAWERYHLDELIPLVDRRLRVRPGRRWHAVAGWSMGGEGAMYYAAQRPGYFGAAASFSGTLAIERPEWPIAFDSQGESFRQVFGDPVAQRFYVRGHDPTGLLQNLRHTRLYVTSGNGVPEPGDPAPFGSDEAYLSLHAREFATAASAAGLDVTYRPRTGRHSFRYWRQHFRDAVAWGFFRPVVEHPARWTYETVAQHGEAWCLRFDFARPPATLEAFRLGRGTLRGAGSGRVRLRTRDGRSFRASLPFARRAPAHPCAPPALALRVHPRRALVGRRVRFRFRVFLRHGGPVRGATVGLAGRRAHTGRRGAATIVVALRHPGLYRARVARRGLRPARALIRAVAPPRLTG